MELFDAWKRQAFDAQGQAVKHVWDDYMAREKKVYQKILREKMTHVEGTVAQVAENFELNTVHMAAFLDGIHAAVDGLPALDEVTEETAITLDIDFKRLYQQMVAYKAKPLYSLVEWDDIFTPEQQKEFYMEQKKKHTVVRSDKVGRNEPCPCGSGKKYKKCCSAKAE